MSPASDGALLEQTVEERMNLFQQLDADWARITASSDARRAAARWRRASPALAHVACPAALVREIRTAETPEQSDSRLSALIAIGLHDQFAGRAVLQALVPGLCSLTRALATLDDRREVESAVVSAAWIRIRTYPHDRRPRRIAANVLLDVRKEVLRTHLRPDQHACYLDVDVPDAEPSSDHELETVLADGVANGLLTPADLHIIKATRLEQRTLADESRSLQISVETLRRRRSRAERRLRILAGHRHSVS